MPVVAQMTIGVDGVTPYGATPEDVARALDAFGADVIGLNCSVGPQTILEAIENMAPITHAEAVRAAERRHAARRRRPQHVHGEPGVHGGVCAAPRAGRREGRRRLLRHHAGAHPGDGRRASVRSARASPRGRVRDGATREPRRAAHAGSAGRCRWPSDRAGARRSRAGEFVTSVEIVPPRGVDAIAHAHRRRRSSRPRASTR